MKWTLTRLKRLINLVFCIAIASDPAVGATPDSLLHALEAAPEESLERAIILHQLGLAYLENSPSQVIRYGDALIHLAQKLGKPEYEFLGYQLSGIGHSISEGLDQGLALHQQALDIASRFNTREWKLRQVKARVNIVGVYWNQRNPEAAYPYNYQNIHDARQLGDSLLLADTYQSMALMLQLDQRYDSSMLYSQQAIALYETLGLWDKKNTAQLTLGNTLLGIGQISEALQLLLKILAYTEAKNTSSIPISLYTSIAKAYLDLGNIALAETYARKSLKQAAEAEILSLQIKGHEAMYEFYLAISRYDSALYYFQAIAELKERILNEQKAKRIQELEISYQTKQKEQEIESLQQKNATTRQINRILVSSTALLLTMMAMTAIFYFRLRRRKEELESLHWEAGELNARLLSMMNEKKHIISLIAHDIRTPLSLIQLNTYLIAQNEGLSEDDRQQALLEIEGATEEINAAGLKIMEIENKTLEKEFLVEEIIEAAPLMEQVIQEFQAHARSKAIQLNLISPPEKLLVFGDPFLLRHILSNLLSNAIKFSPTNSSVEIRLQALKNKITIEVADQGPGLSAEEQQRLFEKTKSPLRKSAAQKGSWGQGLYLTHRFVQAMGGQLGVESKTGEGATFTVSFSAAG